MASSSAELGLVVLSQSAQIATRFSCGQVSISDPKKPHPGHGYIEQMVCQPKCSGAAENRVVQKLVVLGVGGQYGAEEG